MVVPFALGALCWVDSPSCSKRELRSSCGSWGSHWGDLLSRGMGSVAPRQVGSSWTRDWTHVLCLSRWAPNHWPPGTSLPFAFHCSTLGVMFVILAAARLARRAQGA